MFERILVPLDGSELSESILPHATELARRLNAVMVVLQVTPDVAQMLQNMAAGGGMGVGSALMTTELLQEAVDGEADAAKRYLAGLNQRLIGEHVNSQAVHLLGATGTAIIDYCHREDISMIAMSTHGRSGLKRTLFGSVADDVMRNSHIPVMVLRPAED